MKKLIFAILLLMTIPLKADFGNGEFDYSELHDYLYDITQIAPDANYFIVGDGTDWIREKDNTARTSLGLGTTDSPTLAGLTLTGIYPSSLIKTDASKKLSRVDELTDFISGTNNITIDQTGPSTAAVNGALLCPYDGADTDVNLTTYDLIFTGEGGTCGGISFADTAYSTTAEITIPSAGLLRLGCSADLAFGPGTSGNAHLGDNTHYWGTVWAHTARVNNVYTMAGDLSITAADGDITFDNENIETTGKVGFGIGAVGAPGLYMSGSGVETNAGFYRIGANNWGLSFGGVKRFDFSAFGLGNVVGSAAAPSYTFNTDFDTGMFNIAANRLGFAAGGTQRLECNTTGVLVAGTLGIGTSSPNSVFHIKAGTPGTVGSHPAGQLIIQNPTDSVFATAVITGYESDGDGNPDQQLWYFGSSSSSNSDIIFLNRRNSKLALGTNGSHRITILGNGNVGINVTDPDAKLEVVGTLHVSDTATFDGTLGAGAITGNSLTILTTGEINFRDTDISIGSTLFDGILDMSADISIDMFYDNADVGDGVDGQSLNINRRAAEGDDYISLYVDKDRKGLIGFNGDDLLQLAINALTVNGTILVKDKLKFTQDDGNEYIDSLNDGYIDYRATTGHRFGDGTNQTVISATGVVTLEGTAKVVKEQWIDAGGIKAPGAKPATAISHGALETPAWSFANQAVQANEETISFNLKIPPDMDRSVVPLVCLGWSSTTTTGVVEWQLEYLYSQLGETTAGAAEETLYADDTVSGTAEGLVISSFSGINLPHADDVCMHCRVKRLSSATANGGAESDTLADSAELHGTVFIFTSNKLGTGT